MNRAQPIVTIQRNKQRVISTAARDQRSSRAKKSAEPAFDIHTVPGHLIRRTQQIAVALFMEETAQFDFTPLQFALLAELARTPDVDQVTLASLIAVDVATLGQVVARLEERKLVVREADASDRRRKRLAVTPCGRSALTDAIPAVVAAQIRILAPLSRSEQKMFCALLEKLVENNNDASRAPLRRTKVAG